MDKYLEVAAQMFAENGNPKWLNQELRTELGVINRLAENVGGQLISRQVIATAILNWQKRNPDAYVYEPRE